jgi:hypothetical protein
MNIPNILALDNRPVRLTLSTRQGINAVSEVPPLLKSPAVVQETTFIRVTIIVTIVLVIFAIILIVVCMRVQEQHVAQYFFRFCDAGELSGLFRRGFNNNKNEKPQFTRNFLFQFYESKTFTTKFRLRAQATQVPAPGMLHRHWASRRSPFPFSPIYTTTIIEIASPIAEKQPNLMKKMACPR